MMQFSRIGESRVVDCIPMHEILSVAEMQESSDVSNTDSTLSDETKVEADEKANFGRTRRSLDSPTQRFLVRKAVKGQVNTFQIKTVSDGYNSGRTYYIRAKTHATCRKITAELTKLSIAATERANVRSRYEMVKLSVRIVHNSSPFQMFTAFLIVMVRTLTILCILYSNLICNTLHQNFFVNAAESQITDLLTNNNGSLTVIGSDLEKLDEFFTIIFAFELAINAFAHWFRPFISDGWNIFDFFVVSMSLIALGPVKMPVNVIRSLRAFRVLRLFGRLKGLKNIVMALAASVIPVLQALLFLLIIGSICKFVVYIVHAIY